MGEEEGEGESLGEGRAAVGGERQGVQDGDGELEGFEEEGLGLGGVERVLHGLRQLVECPHQLHHPLPAGLLHQQLRSSSGSSTQLYCSACSRHR